MFYLVRDCCTATFWLMGSAAIWSPSPQVTVISSRSQTCNSWGYETRGSPKPLVEDRFLHWTCNLGAQTKQSHLKIFVDPRPSESTHTPALATPLPLRHVRAQAVKGCWGRLTFPRCRHFAMAHQDLPFVASATALVFVAMMWALSLCISHRDAQQNTTERHSWASGKGVGD